MNPLVQVALHLPCPRRSLRLKLSDTRVYEPQIRARLEQVHLRVRAEEHRLRPERVARPAGETLNPQS